MSEWDVVQQVDATPQTGQDDQDGGEVTTQVPPNDGMESPEPQVTNASADDGWEVVDQGPVRQPNATADDGWTVVDQGPSGRQRPSSGEWSVAGSAAAGVAKGAVPTTGGLAAGLASGAAVSPFITPVGGVIVGLGVGALTSWLADMGQDKVLALTGLDKPLNEAREANPTAFDIGTMAPAAALLKPTGTMLQRGVGAGIGVAAEGGMQALHGEFDAKKLAMAGGFGAALPSANRLGNKVIAAGESVPGRYRGGNKGGENANPDVKEIAEPAPTEQDITVAEDQPQVAAGVAVEQQPAPEVPGVGNPEGAAGAVREAARPSDPERNYAKDQPENQPATIESKVVDTEPMKSDIKSALVDNGETPTGEPVQQPEPRADVPQAPEAAPTSPRQSETQIEINGQRQPAQEHAVDQRVMDEPVTVQGEPGKGFDPGPGVAIPKEPPAAPIATGLTPDEIRVAVNARRALESLGYTKVIDAIEQSGLSQKQIAEKFTQAYNAAQSASGEAVGRKTGEIRAETPRQKLSTGAVAASKADAARKEAAVKMVTDVYDEFGPGSEKGKQVDPLDATKIKENRQWVKDTWAEVLKRNDGRDPLLRSKDQYVPLKQGEAHTEAYQWLKALKASAAGQNHKNFAMMHTAKGMGEESRATGKVEGDIAHRPQINEAGGEIETATGAMEQSRTTFEHMKPDPRPGTDNSYVEDHNALADWINERSPREYEKLAEKYDVRAEMDEPADPRSLMSEMKQALADTGRRPKGEITTEVELPPKKVDLPNLPSPKEPANAGRKLDKNSDEFKRLAAQYNAEPVKARVSAEEKLAQLTDAEQTTARLNEERTAIDGSSEKAVMDKIKSFIGDESGAGYIHTKLQSMFSQPANPSSPAALPGAKDYASDLSEKFGKRSAEEKNKKVELMAHLAAAADQKLTPYEHRQIALAEQDNKIGGLPQKLKDYYSDYVAPIRTKAMQMMKDFKDLNDAEGLGYELPNLNAVTTKAYQPRYQVDRQAFNRKETDAFDPFTGTGLGDWAANLEKRKMFAIENGPERMVLEVTGDAKNGFGANIHRGKNQVTVLKNLPASFGGDIGDVLNLNVKGKKGKWTVDQATTREIEKATGIKNYENATWNWAKMYDDVSRAYENAKLTSEIKNDPRFKALTTTDKELAQKNGWAGWLGKKTTHLPDFATVKGQPLFMPKEMRWVFDDYHRPGFGGTTDEGIEMLRNFNVTMLKVFNTNAPLVHVLNELDLGVVSRGLKWLSPKANYEFAKSMPEAIRSVNNQDGLQREMRLAGVNPMLASVGMRSMYETAAKNFGMEIMKNHSQWDPVARAWGMSTKELGQKAYDLSSDVTWRLSDYITTMRYMEEKRGGWSNEDAAKRVNKFMSDYHLKTTVMGSRALQQVLAEPAVTAFGRYKAGVFRSLSHMTADLVKGDPMLRQQARKQGFGGAMAEIKARQEALGQWLVMGALGYGVYPAMDALIQKGTDNEGAEMRRRGITSVADAAKNIVTGEKDPVAMLSRAWTPAPAMQMASDIKANKDFSGKALFPQGDWPGVLPDAAANYAEYGLQQAIPPYATISRNAARPEGSVASGLGALALDQIGAAIPSDASQRRQNRIEKLNSQADKARTKHPSGMIPDFMNRLTD